MQIQGILAEAAGKLWDNRRRVGHCRRNRGVESCQGCRCLQEGARRRRHEYQGTQVPRLLHAPKGVAVGSVLLAD